MIGSIDPDLDEALVECGFSAGTEYSISAILDYFDTYGTGAAHAYDSWADLSGFSGGNIWHYMTAISAEIPFYETVRVTIKNWSQTMYQSGTFYYEIRDASNVLLGYGSESISGLMYQYTTTIDLNYDGSQGVPTRVRWRWTEYKSFNNLII